MKVFAVIDTNVIVSALFTKNEEAATTKVIRAFQQRDIVMLYNEEILEEYHNVLLRPKFKLPRKRIEELMNFIKDEGIPSARIHSDEFFPDPKDVVFYEVALSHDNSFLVTSNIRHFPHKPIVVTPAEMMEILEGNR